MTIILQDMCDWSQSDILNYSGKLNSLQIVKAKLKGKSKNTMKTYRSAFLKWKKFCIRNDIFIFPANRIEFEIFLIQGVEEGYSWPTLKLCFNSVKYFHNVFGFVMHDNIENRDIFDYIRSQARKTFNRKRPLLKNELDKLLFLYDENNLDLVLLRDLSIIIFMWFGFLRYSDVAELKCSEIERRDGMFDIFIKAGKTDRFRNGQNVLVKLNGMHKKILDEYERIVFSNMTDCAESYFFFIVKQDGKCLFKEKLEYNDVRFLILKRCSQVDIDITNLGTHSLRIGGCTEASKRGVPDYVLDVHGRWCYNSQSRARYQRVDQDDHVRLCDVLNE